MQIMKRIVSALFAGMLLLAAPAMHADDKKGHDPHAQWDRFDMLKKRLGLTADQVSQWKDAEKGDREQGKLLKDKTKADEASLAVLVDEKASDDDLKAGLDLLEKDHQAMQASREKKIGTLKGILTPMQQAKLVMMMGGHGGFGGGMGRRGAGCGRQGHDGGKGHGD